LCSPIADSAPVGLIGLPTHTVHIETAMFLDEVRFVIEPGFLGEGTARYEGPLAADRFPVSGHTDESLYFAGADTIGPWRFDYDEMFRAGELAIQIEARYDRTADPASYLKPPRTGQTVSEYALPMGLAPFQRAGDQCLGLFQACLFQESVSGVPERLGRLALLP
jgi:hypothetical protein